MAASSQDEQRLASDIVALTALPARWAGAPAQRMAEDVAASLYHLCPSVSLVSVRLELPPSRRIEVWRPKDAPAPSWRDEEGLVRAPNEVILPIGPLARHGAILLVATGGPPLAHARLLGVIAANELEAACRALDLEGDVAQAREKLAALGKLGALGQLVGGVAHEVRTPLTYAMNNLFALERRLRETEGDAARAVSAEIREIEGALDRINAIVGQLRRFAKHEVATHLEEDLRDLVRDALRLWRATHAGGCEVHDALRPTPPVEVDRGQLQQVVLNLVQNAADAVGAHGRIRVETGEGDGHALLVIADAGPGMSPEVQARLFQPFHTTKPDGLGLGLSIVRGIVEAHHGSVHIRSAPGQGTRVEVRIPRAHLPPGDAAPT